jgi:hypothetical protein
MTEPNGESDLENQIAAWHRSGVAIPEIERRLSESGFTPAQASNMVDAVLAKEASDTFKRQRKKDRVTFFVGISLCFVSVVLMLSAIGGFVDYRLGLLAAGASAVASGVTLIIRVKS